MRWNRLGSLALFSLLLGCAEAAAPNRLPLAPEFLGALEIGADLAASEHALRVACTNLESVEGSPLRLPTTVESEQFVRCDLVASPERLGLSYSDRKLVLVEIRGQDLIDALTARIQASEQPVRYANRDIYPTAALALSPQSPRAWMFAPADLPAHLFLFSNPLLEERSSAQPSEWHPELVPNGLRPGADLGTARADLAAACPLLEEKEISPPKLPSNPDVQIQINCFGFEVGGFPRKVELVFGDGTLELIWILTGAQEHPRVRRHLTRIFGPHARETRDYVIWPGGVGLSKDKPEILIATPQVADFFFQNR